MQINHIFDEHKRKNKMAKALFQKQSDMLDKVNSPITMLGMFILGGFVVAAIVLILG